MDRTTKILINIAVFGAFGGSVFGLAIQYLIRNNIRNSICYNEALKSLTNHPEAQRQLGQPILDGRIDLGDKIGNGSEGTKLWFTVPVRGPKSQGKMMYFVDEVNESDRKYKVTRVELELDHIKDKKLLVKKEQST